MVLEGRGSRVEGVGRVTLILYGGALVEPMGLKSWVKRTDAPASLVARMASTWMVVPATGNWPPTICKLVIAGPMVSSVAKVAVKGSPAARLPARSNTLLTTRVWGAFGRKGAAGTKLKTWPLTPTPAAPATAPPGPVTMKTNPVA